MRLMPTILAFGVIGLLQAPAWSQFPGTPPPNLGRPSSGPRKGDGPQPTPTPMPDSGSTEAYNYQRSSRYPGYYEVNYSDGEQTVVSENFLRMATHGPAAAQPEQSRKMLDSYPEFVDQVYSGMMENWYPDSTGETTEDFEAQVVGSTDGPNASFESDPLAPQYVRVSLKDESGQLQEFSVSRKAAEMILNRPDLTDAEKLKALSTLPMRLPESARANFKNLSKEELWAEVAKDPKTGSQEFIRSKQVVAEVQQEAAATAGETTGSMDSATTAAQEAETPAIAKTTDSPMEAPVAATPTSDPTTADRDSGDESKPADTATEPPLADEGSPVPLVLGIVLLAALALGGVLFWRKRQL